MAEVNIPSNSHKSKTPAQNDQKKEVTPVVSGGVTKKERSKNSFLADDFRDVKNYVVSDVIVPAAKSTIVDIVSKGINMLIYGEDRAPSRNGTRFNYNSVSRRDYRDDRDRQPRARVRSVYDYEDLIFDTRIDAERVLEEMCDIFDSHESVSIGDMYDLAGQQTQPSDFDYGWTDIRTATVEPYRGGGYYIYLPRPTQLSRR